jgi:hypothetical protein
MEIYFFLEDQMILAVNYFKMINHEESDEIIINKENILYFGLSNPLIINNDLKINISFKNFNSQYVFHVSDVLININEIQIMGSMIDPLKIFDQGYLDNFKLLTDNNEQIKWYDLNTKQKYYYLRGCYLLSGIKDSLDDVISVGIQIDFSKVRTELDFYYEVSTAFFGEYGYFGTEINSFLDCLYSIGVFIRSKEKPLILNILGYENFSHFLKNTSIFKTFFEEFGERNIKFTYH